MAAQDYTSLLYANAPSNVGLAGLNNPGDVVLHWQETEEIAPSKVPADVVDLVFALDGGRIPVDHAQSLAQAVCAVLPGILRYHPALPCPRR